MYRSRSPTVTLPYALVLRTRMTIDSAEGSTNAEAAPGATALRAHTVSKWRATFRWRRHRRRATGCIAGRFAGCRWSLAACPGSMRVPVVRRCASFRPRRCRGFWRAASPARPSPLGRTVAARRLHPWTTHGHRDHPSPSPRSAVIVSSDPAMTMLVTSGFEVVAEYSRLRLRIGEVGRDVARQLWPVAGWSRLIRAGRLTGSTVPATVAGSSLLLWL